MADPLLHIKDSYFFEVPKFAWPRDYKSRTEFPEVWVRLDPDYQKWEAERLYNELTEIAAEYNRDVEDRDQQVVLPAREELIHDWEHWQHAPVERGKASNHGKPFDAFLEQKADVTRAQYEQWKTDQKDAADKSFASFLQEHPHDDEWLARLLHRAEYRERWQEAKELAEDVEAYQTDPDVHEWDKAKLEKYNHHLSGKILIPQPFGKLRNLHESESGFTLSKYVVIQLMAAVLLFVLFRWLAVRVKSGGPPRGRLWNMLEGFLVFIRDQIARPAIGHHEADRFVPLLWTIFMFILVCNLFGMIPMFGAPTAVWGVTFAMALVTLGAVTIGGMRQFGPVGFFLNQVPHMDLPWYMAIVIKPMVFVIEVVGLLIRHLVLSIRLLANMVAGHLVILGVMAVVFGASAAMDFADAPGWQWGIAASLAVIGSALFSLLELLVAFLQAYIFTFLSALFIGAAIHHH